MSTVRLDHDLEDVVLSVMEGLSCARSLTVAILARYGEWDQVVSLATDPSDYDCSERYWAAVQATDLLRKCQGLPTTFDTRAEALKSFWESERTCCRTNARLDPLVDGYLGDLPVALHDFIVMTRKIILSWIGPCPPSTWEGRFGPGATMSDSSQVCTIPDKLSSVPTLTTNALFHLVPWTGTQWSKAQAALGNCPIVIRGNSFFTVDKSAKTDRGCCKEPSLNGFYQLGLGRVLRQRLLSAGFDLKRGQDVHRRVACTASLGGHLATIDLSSASDTVCVNLVKLMLPRAWFEALSSLRSPFTRVDGRWVRLEKFSSMGNGYTFELETLLFGAISQACCPAAVPGKDLFVFGDDIIVPTAEAKGVLSALAFFGFSPNKRKTFLNGEFRESCGGDFFRGVGVRPYLLEEIPDEPQKWISFANGLRRSAFQADHCLHARWDLLRRSWFRCQRNLPIEIRRLRGPAELGDLVLHDDDPSKWCSRWRNGRNVRYIRVYRPVRRSDVRWEGFAYEVQFAAALYGITEADSSRVSQSTPDEQSPVWCPKGHKHDLVSRRAVAGYKVGWVPFS